jgi:hypothetical protein
MRRLLLILFSLLPVLSFADNVEIRASAPARVGKGQNFHVQFSANQQGSVSLPATNDFRLLGGPSTGTSHSMQVINGQVTQSVTYTYTYTYQALNTGSFVFPAASFSSGGKTYQFNAINIEVLEQQTSQGGQPRQQHDPWAHFFGDPQAGQQQQQQQTPQDITSEDLYIRMHVSNTNPWRGQGIIASLKLYTKVDVVRFEDMHFPQFNSFWIEEIETPERINMQRENINGEAFNVGLIRKYELFPRYSGDIKIEQSELKCLIRQLVQGGGRSLIDQFFGSYQTVSKTIKSPEVNIKVRELPHNNSSFFKGTVGTYSLSTKLSRDTLIVNEAVSLEVSIKGTGNLSMVESPEILFPKEFEVYDPQTINNFSAGANGVSGTKIWEYTIIPRYPGIFELGQIIFEFFDPASGEYKQAKSNPITIAVRRDEHDTDFGKTVYNYNQRSIDYIGDDDIRFIKIGNLNLKDKSLPLVSSTEYKVLYISSMLIFLAFVIVRRKKIKENANLALVRNKRANKISKKRMNAAAKFMKQENKTEFYKEVINALWGYVADKLSIDTADLKRETAIEKLEEYGVDNDITENLMSVIDRCEYAHFAPAGHEAKMETIYNEAVEIIKTLEQNLKR